MSLKKFIRIDNLDHDGQQPGAVAGHTGVHIRESTSAGNTPGHGADGVSSGDQWATRVSHAGTLAGLGEGAYGVVEDQGSVGSRVTATAVSVGKGAGVQEHQVGGSASGML